MCYVFSWMFWKIPVIARLRFIMDRRGIQGWEMMPFSALDWFSFLSFKTRILWIQSDRKKYCQHTYFVHSVPGVLVNSCLEKVMTGNQINHFTRGSHWPTRVRQIRRMCRWQVVNIPIELECYRKCVNAVDS